MWLTSSSIGRKVVMSVTGTALILFLTFHMAMNVVYIFSEEGYNMVCEFLGANWYAVAATLALAALLVIHIIYAFWLNLQNLRARGKQRYAVSGKQPIEWEAKNMLLLGVIVICGLALHGYNFWFKMMFAELTHTGDLAHAADGSYWIAETFKCPVYVIIYVIWIAALWLHMNHGFWSAMHTLGWNNNLWLNRWICISRVYSTVICLGFLAVLLAGVLKNCGCLTAC